MAGEAVRATPTGQHQDGNPEETEGKDDEVVDEGAGRPTQGRAAGEGGQGALPRGSLQRGGSGETASLSAEIPALHLEH